MKLNWINDRHENYIKLEGHDDALVRTKRTPNGRFLWSVGKVFDWADTVEAAKEMVEGLVIANSVIVRDG